MNEEVLAKIRKLRRLAASADEHEAAAAAGAAQALMSKYQIDEAILSFESEDGPAAEEPVKAWEDPLDVNKSKIAWKGTLASGIARANGCRVLYFGGNIRIIGTATNVSACRYLYAWLAEEIDRIARIRGAGNGRAWAHAFRVGCAQAVADRLRQAAADAKKAALSGATTAGAIVLVNRALAVIDRDAERADKFIKDTFHVRTAHRSRVSDSSGFVAGKETGERMSLHGSARRLA